MLHHYDVRLVADSSRVVIRPFHVAPEPRSYHAVQTGRMGRIVKAVMALSPDECTHELEEVNVDFATRHWQANNVYMERFERIAFELSLEGKFNEAQRRLIGAYFCHEYSYAAAAIMNPSIVPHFDQSGLPQGARRFIMSLRTVGEGHISSISFREGIIDGDGALNLWPQPSFTIAAECDDPHLDGPIVVRRPSSVPISGTVIFPFTRAQRNGLEDLRLVRFVEDDGEATFYGTYTAYSGIDIRSELLSTKDFTEITLTPMTGDASKNKGMALFPRRINGGYAMIGRQDGESTYFLQSDSLTDWEGGERIMSPKFPWELVQIGNCGAPIELDEGWLLLTHGVGAMRKYSIGAALLDKTDPRKVLGRSRMPLLSPSGENREGYVPNVLYSCGALKNGGDLLLPYGVADSAVSFARINLKSLIDDLI